MIKFSSSSHTLSCVIHWCAVRPIQGLKNFQVLYFSFTDFSSFLFHYFYSPVVTFFLIITSMFYFTLLRIVKIPVLKFILLILGLTTGHIFFSVVFLFLCISDFFYYYHILEILTSQFGNFGFFYISQISVFWSCFVGRLHWWDLNYNLCVLIVGSDLSSDPYVVFNWVALILFSVCMVYELAKAMQRQNCGVYSGILSLSL